MYIITTLHEPPQFWNETQTDFGLEQGWTSQRELATVFTGAQREKNPDLPTGGCWVLLSDGSRPYENHIKRHHFTTIKLQPLVIRLSSIEGDYETLNARALEFEASLRLWIDKQKEILGDGWQVDVITED